MSRARAIASDLGGVIYLGRQIFIRDFRSRYRRALLGFAWVVAPVILLSASALLVTNQIGVDLGTQDIPYPLFVLVGTVYWGLFAEGLSGPQQICRRSRMFLRRVPINHTALLVASVHYQLLNFLFRLPLIIVALAWYSFLPSSNAWLAIPYLVALGVLGLSLGALLAPVSLVVLDIRYALPFLLVGLLILTPVLYAPPESGIMRVVSDYNPLAQLIVAARDLTLRAHSAVLIPASITSAAVLLLLAPFCLYYFQRSMPTGLVHI